MKKFVITVEVKSVKGEQRFLVEAPTARDAVVKFNQQGGEFIDEELEVTSLKDASLGCVREKE